MTAGMKGRRRGGIDKKREKSRKKVQIIFIKDLFNFSSPPLVLAMAWLIITHSMSLQ